MGDEVGWVIEIQNLRPSSLNILLHLVPVWQLNSDESNDQSRRTNLSTETADISFQPWSTPSPIELISVRALLISTINQRTLTPDTKDRGSQPNRPRSFPIYCVLLYRNAWERTWNKAKVCEPTRFRLMKLSTFRTRLWLVRLASATVRERRSTMNFLYVCMPDVNIFAARSEPTPYDMTENSNISKKHKQNPQTKATTSLLAIQPKAKKGRQCSW